MKNKRTAAFALTVTALMLLASAVCIPTAKAEADDDPPVGLYDSNGSYLDEDPMLQNASFPVNTDKRVDPLTEEVKTMALAGSVLPVNGAQLWVNGIGEAEGKDVTVSMQLVFEPIEDAPNTTGDWLLKSGLKVTLDPLPDLEVGVSGTSFVLDDGTDEGDHMSDAEEFASVTGAKYSLKLELATDIDLSLVGDIRNMTFIFCIEGEAVSVTFKNGEDVLKVEVVSDNIKGPSQDPTSTDHKLNVFVGWNENADVDPEFAQWVEDLDIDITTLDDAIVYAIFAQRGDMNGDGILNKADAIYLMSYVIEHIIDPYSPLYPIKQNPQMNTDQAMTKADATYLMSHIIEHIIDPDSPLYPLKDNDHWRPPHEN